MNLTDRARLHRVPPQTAYRWFREGTPPVPAVRVSSRSVLVVPGPAGAGGDLVRDMTEILTLFCARLYGRRLARNRAEKALRCAVGPSSPEVTG